MGEAIITVAGLSKSYVLHHQRRESYTALRDVITNKARGLFTRGITTRTTQEEFFALRDVGFEVKAGERVGIIGRNGAGKSTLLKVLSRITEPTKGRITLNGRVASLLEVGTGFHPELSGRENIYLNGAILGLSRNEIRARFDEIVAFSEVERFLDTPVKRYSSGMYVRLAFAVAAHLEPEILIVDEVLAVGDAEFQRKCIGKMRDISTGQGRTILFVSHNMGAIRTFCDRCLQLDQGVLVADGPTQEVLPKYFGSGERTRLDGFTISAAPADSSGEWVTGTALHIDVRWEHGRYSPGFSADLAFYTLEGEKLFALQSQTLPGTDLSDPATTGVRFSVINPGLVDRDIRLDVGVRPAGEQQYNVVLQNALLLSPSNKGILHNRVPDVLLVPTATCVPITA